MAYKIGKGISLREYLSRCIEDEEKGEWMIAEEMDYTMDMLVYPVSLTNWDIEPEEYERIEEEVLSQDNGYGNVLNAGQLIDIVDVLKRQKPNYSEQELEASINFYSERDTFLEL
jgi:hypothetical protein